MTLNDADGHTLHRDLQRIEGHAATTARWVTIIGAALLAQLLLTIGLLVAAITGQG